MDKLSGISSISKNLFRSKTKKAESTCQNQTNPFGVSFKGKMIIAADVFDKAASESKLSLSERLIERSKNLSSRLQKCAAVASIADFASNVGSRLNSIADYGRRMRDNVSNMWNNARNSKIGTILRSDIKDVISSLTPQSKQSLSTRPVSELENMLTASINDMSLEVK